MNQKAYSRSKDRLQPGRPIKRYRSWTIHTYDLAIARSFARVHHEQRHQDTLGRRIRGRLGDRKHPSASPYRPSFSLIHRSIIFCTYHRVQADFSNIAQTKPQRRPSSDLAANLRPSAPTFQPRTTKPPTPRLWEPEPPVAPSGSRTMAGTTVSGTGGTGRSVLLGPAIEGRESTPSSSNADLAVRSRTQPAQADAQTDASSPEKEQSTPIPTSAQPLPITNSGSGSGTSLSTPDLSGSTIRATTILMKREPAASASRTSTSTASQGMGNTSSPFGDDDEWNLDPRTTVVSNSQLWEQA